MKTTPGGDSNFLIEEIKKESKEGQEILQRVNSIEGLQKIEEATEKYFKGEIAESRFNNIFNYYTSSTRTDFFQFKEAKINEYLLKFINKEISEEDFNKFCEVTPELKSKYSMYQRNLKTSNEIADVFMEKNNI